MIIFRLICNAHKDSIKITEILYQRYYCNSPYVLSRFNALQCLAINWKHAEEPNVHTINETICSINENWINEYTEFKYLKWQMMTSSSIFSVSR